MEKRSCSGSGRRRGNEPWERIGNSQPQRAGYGRTQPDTRQTASDRFHAGQRRFPQVVAGDGFEPSKAEPTVLQRVQPYAYNHVLTCADNVLLHHLCCHVPYWFHSHLGSALTGTPPTGMAGILEPTPGPLPRAGAGITHRLIRRLNRYAPRPQEGSQSGCVPAGNSGTHTGGAAARQPRLSRGDRVGMREVRGSLLRHPA
jgi:hypothetical protein